MSKREIRSFAAAGVDVDAPRAKRRKEAPATSTVSTSPNGKADDTAPVNGENGAGTENATVQAEDPAEVKEKGLQVWHTVKDAVNKECVPFRSSLSHLTLTSYRFLLPPTTMASLALFSLAQSEGKLPPSLSCVCLRGDNIPITTD